MSNFYHDSTFSPATEAVLDEQPVSLETTLEEKPAPKEVVVRKPEQSYALFHYALLVHMYLFCTRLPELFPSIRPSLAMSIILLAGLFATGKGSALVNTKLGRLLLAFTAWTAICVPFSVFVGGSLETLKGVAQATLISAFIIAFIGNLKEVRHAMYTIALAMGTVAVLSNTIFHATTGLGEERIGLFSSATLQDPNFMSLYLLIGLPFLWLGLTTGKWLTKIVFAPLLLLAFFSIAQSASRMALFLLMVGFVIFLIQSSNKERAFALVGATVLSCVMVPLLPQSTTNRFLTLFKANKDETIESKDAAESAQMRLFLLFRSVELTFKNPLFGVGPGQFMVAEDKLAKAEGRERGIWYYSHNAYTETSSEVGIVGLVIYLMAMVTAFRGLGSIRKRGPTPEIRAMARAVQLSFWMVILGGLFLTIGFGGVPFVIMGLAVAFKLAVSAEIKSGRAALTAA